MNILSQLTVANRVRLGLMVLSVAALAASSLAGAIADADAMTAARIAAPQQLVQPLCV